jgi:protein-tyrosine-phosphatase
MGILRALAAERGQSGWDITSAGLWAYPGAPATPHAVEVAGELGIDLSGHRAVRFEAEQAAECDLILALSGEHFEQVSAWGRAIAEKTYLLKQFPRHGDPGPAAWVRDPLGGDIEAYRRTFEELDEILRRIFSGLVNRAETARS